VVKLKKRPRDEHTPPARSATCGAKSPALSVAANHQRNLQAERIVEIPLRFQSVRSNVAFHFLRALHSETFSLCSPREQSR
jgi:hypothetical protein